jgi:hypothetical protein
MGFQEQSPSCHAGHDGDHLKYRIMSNSMRVSRHSHGFTRYYSA